MDYVLSFIEGIITFISPCLLPMLPIYISYFAGGEAAGRSKKKRALSNALGFVLGFTVVFVLLGAAAGTFGSFVKEHEAVLNIAGGIIVIIFGLSFMGALDIGFLNRTKKLDLRINTYNFFTSILFGFIFAIGWTPCVGAFLGSALILAASSRSVIKGIAMLLLFSAGLGIPFIVSAVLIEKLNKAFDAIKKHYRIIKIVSGALLVAVGVLMMLGKMVAFAAILSFK